MSRVAVLGEVLWDLYEHSRKLGGAPLNFGVHARRLGHEIFLISAVGSDELGTNATDLIQTLDLNVRLFQTTSRHSTGTAQVLQGQDGKPQFTILRPAAYDALSLSACDLEFLAQQAPDWLYYGTLFAATPQGRSVLQQLLEASRPCKTFYDLNLRPGADKPKLVRELLGYASVVKVNEDELERVAGFAGLPKSPEAFCRAGTHRFGWSAVGVTLGDKGCAILAHGEFVTVDGHRVHVADTVGAGDAFAAAFMHGLNQNWPAGEIATFANRVGALVASRHGAIPDWTLDEAVKL